MDTRKNKKIKSILGYLQEDVPGAPVDAQEMDEVEDPLPPDEEDLGVAPSVPMAQAPDAPDLEDELLRKKKKRRGLANGADTASTPAFMAGLG